MNECIYIDARTGKKLNLHPSTELQVGQAEFLAKQKGITIEIISDTTYSDVEQKIAQDVAAININSSYYNRDTA